MATVRARAGASLVAAGILVSRLAGFVRERALAHVLGNSASAGAFRAALRIPNLLQNLLGEGVLSASFIPVYARLEHEGRHEEATRVARAVGTLLGLVASLACLVGVVLARPLIEVLAPGFEGPTRELTITLVRILFPGTALLVLSAWCLGVLNAHRKFFLSYASPVLWNAALIAVCVAAALRHESNGDTVARWLAWGAVVGSGLQLLVQLPSVYALLRTLRPSLDVKLEGVRTTLRAFGPVFLGRGSVQISAYLDQLLASYLGPVMVAAMGYAQTIYLLPVSLFGMAISAAELPEMARSSSDPAAMAAHIRGRLEPALRRVTFLVVPSAIAFVTIGRTLVALLFRTGRFGADDVTTVWLVLAGAAVGLTASTQGRLLSSAFYALGDTRAPLRAALARVTVTFVAGYAVTLPLRAHFGYAPVWAAFGLTATAGVAAWLELALLARWLKERIGSVPLPFGLTVRATAAAALAGGVGYLIERALVGQRPWIVAAAVVPAYGVIYGGVTLALGVPEARGVLRRIARRRG